MESPELRAALCAFCLALPLSIAGANIGWGLVLAALLLRWRSGSPPRWEAARSWLEVPLWIYLAACAASSAAGVDPLRSASFLHQDAHKLWFYYLMSWALARPAGRAPLSFLAAGFAVAALCGVSQALASKMTLRAHAFVHPVTFGEQAAIGLLGAFCFLVRPDPETSSGAARRGVWALAFLLLAAMLLSNTRGAAAGAAAGCLAVLLLVRELRRWSARALLACAGGLALMEGAAFFMGRSLVGGRGQFLRLSLWEVALRMGLDHPWLGVGLNNYRTAFPGYYLGIVEGPERVWGSAHNLFLHQFAERGLLGLCALLLLLAAFWIRALDRVREKESALNLWAFSSATAFLVMNLTEVALEVEIVWMLVFFVWLLAEAGHRAREGGHGFQ
jgi:O-antigen ligase